MDDFVALDVETANASLASICQIGIVEFSAGQIVSQQEWLVDPEEAFDGMNMHIHGIHEEHVKGQPVWRDLYPTISELLNHKIVVTHTAFDRTSLRRVCGKYGLDEIDCAWVDSARMARRVWAECHSDGSGLKKVAKMLGITFKHHNAREDARAAGEVAIQAMVQSGIQLSEWVLGSPYGESPRIAREGNAGGDLFGEVVAFTGLLSMPRSEAADVAARAGCSVGVGVTKHTTLLVAGDQDVRVLNGHEKSSKHRKAEQLIADGQALRIVGESDFWVMIALHSKGSKLEPSILVRSAGRKPRTRRKVLTSVEEAKAGEVVAATTGSAEADTIKTASGLIASQSPTQKSLILCRECRVPISEYTYYCPKCRALQIIHPEKNAALSPGFKVLVGIFVGLLLLIVVAALLEKLVG